MLLYLSSLYLCDCFGQQHRISDCFESLHAEKPRYLLASHLGQAVPIAKVPHDPQSGNLTAGNNTMFYHSRTIYSASSTDEATGAATAQSLLATILALCNESKTSFEDPDFGPTLTEQGMEFEEDFNLTLKKKLSDRAYQTISKTFRRAESNRTKLLQHIQLPGGKALDATQLSWLPNDTATSSVVSDRATPSFPVQGAVGSNWLLGAMAMLAVTRPKFLQEIFVCPSSNGWARTHKQSRYGTIPVSTRNVYMVRLFYELKWHYVVVDGRVPRGHSGRPTFARCADATEIWVSLIEKAVAKLCGGYDKLHQSGTVDFGLHLLTGCATHTIRGGGFQGNDLPFNDTLPNTDLAAQQALVKKDTAPLDRPALYTQLSHFVNAGFAVGCERRQRLGNVHNLSFKSPSARATFTDTDGVLIRHAYVVVDVGEVRGTKLVRLVNPWMVNPWPTVGRGKKGGWLVGWLVGGCRGKEMFGATVFGATVFGAMFGQDCANS
jgi:hypothetical protein